MRVGVGVLSRATSEVGRVSGHVSEQQVREKFAVEVAQMILQDGSEARVSSDQPFNELGGCTR